MGHGSFLFALLCLAFTPAFAQTPEIREVTLRFLFLDESPGAYQLQTGSSLRTLGATPYAVSRPVKAKPADRLRIFKNALIPDPQTGAKTRAQIATVTPPADAADVLVVVTPRPLEPGSAVAPVYDVAFFDSTPATFPPGSVRVLNLGHAAMAASFGSEPVVVPPGSASIVRPVADARHRVFSRVAIQDAGGWRPLSSAIAVVRPAERLTGICVYSPSGLAHTYLPEEIAERGPPAPGHFWLTFSENP